MSAKYKKERYSSQRNVREQNWVGWVGNIGPAWRNTTHCWADSNISICQRCSFFNSLPLPQTARRPAMRW